MTFNAEPIWSKDGYTLRDIRRRDDIKKLGETLHNCLTRSTNDYAYSLNMRKSRIYAFCNADKALTAIELKRSFGFLFFTQIAAKYNHAINGTEPFYGPLQHSIAHIRSLYSETILNAVGANPLETEKSMAKIALDFVCNGIKPGIADLIHHEIQRGLTIPLMDALHVDERFSSLSPPQRMMLNRALLPYTFNYNSQQVNYGELALEIDAIDHEFGQQ